MSSIKKRLAKLEEAHQAQQPTVKRSLNDFYNDVSDPNSEMRLFLNSFYAEAVK